MAKSWKKWGKVGNMVKSGERCRKVGKSGEKWGKVAKSVKKWGKASPKENT